MTNEGRKTAIKGFDANMQCRGFQFEVGQTYRHNGPVKACRSGFHAIPEDQHPLAVFGYYAPAGSRFCVVEVDGQIERTEGKIAAEILKVTRDISLGELANEAVKFVMDRAKLEGPIAVNENGLATASGTQGAATASGDQGAATASGWMGKVIGADGNALFAVEREASGNIISVACAIVGKDGIKADTWYRCEGGKMVEVPA